MEYALWSTAFIILYIAIWNAAFRIRAPALWCTAFAIQCAVFLIQPLELSVLPQEVQNSNSLHCLKEYSLYNSV